MPRYRRLDRAELDYTPHLPANIREVDMLVYPVPIFLGFQNRLQLATDEIIRSRKLEICHRSPRCFLASDHDEKRSDRQRLGECMRELLPKNISYYT